jgi:hypothetical protein
MSDKLVVEEIMNDKSKSTLTDADVPKAPEVVEWAKFQAELDALRVREKAHTHEGDAIAAARRPTAQWARLEAGRFDDLGNVGP